MFRIGSILLLASLCAGAATAQTVSRTVCSAHLHQCVTYFSDGSHYTSEYYPYQRTAQTATPNNNTAHAKYYRYLQSTTATMPYGTVGPGGFQQQCNYDYYLQTYQCR